MLASTHKMATMGDATGQRLVFFRAINTSGLPNAEHISVAVMPALGGRVSRRPVARLLMARPVGCGLFCV